MHRGMFSGDRFMLYAELDSGELAFLVAGEKQVGQRPYYILASHQSEFDHNSDHFLGRLMGNAVCTQYCLHGRRRHSKRRSRNSGSAEADQYREELAVVRFKKPGNAPRTMEVVIPSIAADGSRCESRPKDPEREGLQSAWNDKPDWRKALGMSDFSDSEEDGAAGPAPPREPWYRMASTSPRWDEQRNVYTMDFHGRVKRSSAKNFQLAPAGKDFKALPGADGDLVMQFGRLDDDSFSLDVAYPLSPAQALAISLSMFDSRIVEMFRMYY